MEVLSIGIYNLGVRPTSEAVTCPNSPLKTLKKLNIRKLAMFWFTYFKMNFLPGVFPPKNTWF